MDGNGKPDGKIPGQIDLDDAELDCLAQPYARAAELERKIGAVTLEALRQVDALRADHAKEMAAYNQARADLYRRHRTDMGHMSLDVASRRLVPKRAQVVAVVPPAGEQPAQA